MSHTENFPRKAFEAACHAMGVLEQNREYLQFHLKNADEKTQQALADMQRGAARLERTMSEMEDLLALHDPPPARRWMDLRDVLAQADAMGPEIARALGLTLTVAQPGRKRPARCWAARTAPRRSASTCCPTPCGPPMQGER